MIPGPTERLQLRRLTLADDAFVHRLMNDKAWLDNIGDRGIQSLADARSYLRDGPWTRYDELGFGFYVVERRDSPQAIGVCGLAQRPHLDAPDIGFAFLPEGRRAGYAMEAARAVVSFAESLGLQRIVATTRPENTASKRLLDSLGMTETRRFKSPASGQLVVQYELRLCQPATRAIGAPAGT